MKVFFNFFLNLYLFVCVVIIEPGTFLLMFYPPLYCFSLEFSFRSQVLEVYGLSKCTKS